MKIKEKVTWLILTFSLILAACASPAVEPTAALVAAVATAAPAPAPTVAPTEVPVAPTARPERRLNVLLSGKPLSFNPLASPLFTEELVSSLVHDTLVAYTPDGLSYEMRLAEKWDLSPDSKKYTFTLRAGLTWSDGQPFTSDDVLFTYNLLATKAVSAQSGKLAGVKGVKEAADGTTKMIAGFSAPDATTFVIELEKPNGALVNALAWPFIGILPKHILGNVPPDKLKAHPFMTAPTVGMGPFTFVRWETDQYIEFARNPRYYKNVDIDRVFLREMLPEAAEVAMEKGELDLAPVDSKSALRLATVPNVSIVAGANPGINLISAKIESGPLSDVRVRQALLYAIDRKGIINKVHLGRAKIVNTFNVSAGIDFSKLNSYEYSPEKAKELLKEAKWDPNYVIEMKWIPGLSAARDQTNEIVQANWAAVGVKMELMPVERGPVLEAYKERTFGATAYGGGFYTADGDSVSVPVSCATKYPAGTNITHYCNQEVEDLLIQARGLNDLVARTALYQKIAEITNADVTNFWLNVTETLVAHSDRLKGYVPYGLNGSQLLQIANFSVD